LEPLEDRRLLSYAVTDLGTLGGTDGQALSINDRGQVTGSANTAGDAQTHAFLYSRGTMTDLGTLGGSTSYGFGINDRGQVAGGAATPGDAGFHTFLYCGGAMTDLGTLGGTFSEASAINSSGVVVGESTLPGDTVQDSFIYSHGVMTDLMTLLPPGSGVTNLTVMGINDRGQTVGFGSDANGPARALLLTPSSGGDESLGAASPSGLAQAATAATVFHGAGASSEAPGVMPGSPQPPRTGRPFLPVRMGRPLVDGGGVDDVAYEIGDGIRSGGSSAQAPSRCRLPPGLAFRRDPSLFCASEYQAVDAHLRDHGGRW
jgi:probable HAF family extracellular repeat protein